MKESTAPRTRRTAAKKAAETQAAAAVAALAPVVQISNAEREEMIRRTAYALYESRGSVGGNALDDWLKAEAMIDQSVAERNRGEPNSSH
jgi:hypothetical protein